MNPFSNLLGSDSTFMVSLHFPRERVVRNISRHDFEGMKKKLLIANDKDISSSLDQSNQGYASDSDGDDCEDCDGEPMWPDTGDVNEFPELIDARRIKKT